MSIVAFSEAFYHFAGGISFAVVALAAGMWMMLATFWWRNLTGVRRIAFLWLAATILSGMLFRLSLQLGNFETHEFPVEEWIRLGLNVSYACVAVYMLKNKIGAND